MHRTQHRLDPIRHPMALTELRPYATKTLRQGHRLEG